MTIRTTTGTPSITSDTGGLVAFTLGGITFAIGATEPPSWFETLKYAHRNHASIAVIDDDSVTRYAVNGTTVAIPTDLHDA